MHEPDERATRFAKYVFDLETKLKSWLLKTPEDQSDYMLRRNVKSCDRAFRESLERCNAPRCGYPLRNDGGGERLPYVGDVCHLCYFMYHIVAARKWFADAQREDDAENARRKK